MTALSAGQQTDPDCRCGDGRWSHKRGAGGCRVMDCPCGKYDPPKVDQSGEPTTELVQPAAVPVTPAESADLLGGALDLARRQLEQVTRERNAAQAELEQYCAADLDRRRAQLEARQHLAAELGQARSRINELTAEVDRLRAELDVVNASRLRALDALDEAARISLAEVLLRYDADQCTTDGCGSRYTVPVEHEHPLTPVTVLVVRREAPGA